MKDTVVASAPPTSWSGRLQARAEEWIYAANERNHPLFRLYDRFNETAARLFLRSVRRRAQRLDLRVSGRDAEARLRFLGPEDGDRFAALLSGFDFKYLPPHELDRATAERALRRWSYVPLGIFHEERLVGYLLIRLFFLPRRAVSGIWSLREAHNRGFSRACFKAAGDFTDAAGLENYCTIPLDNLFSFRTALWAGFDVIRTNRRFHVLRRTRPGGEGRARPGADGPETG